jgi:myosin heavy subunit
MDITWANGSVTRLYIPVGAYRTLEGLRNGLSAALQDGAQRLCDITARLARKRRAVIDNSTPNAKRQRQEEIEEHEENEDPEEEAHPPLDPEYIAAKSAVALGAEKKRLVADVNRLNKDLDALEERRKTEVDMMGDQIKLLNNQLKTLRSSSSADKTKITELEEQLSTAINDKSNAETKSNTEVTRLRDDLKKTQSRIAELESTKSTLETEKADIEKARADAEKSRVETAEGLESSRQQLKSVEERYGTLQTQLQEVETTKNAAVLSANAKEMELTKTRARYEAQYAEITARLAELERRPTENVPPPVTYTPEGCNAVESTAPFTDLAQHLRFLYDEESERFILKMHKEHITGVRLSDHLAYMLGFEKNLLEKDRNEARYTPDLHGSVHSLYIYAPKLIESSIVGDTWSPLLRIAKVRGAPGEYVEEVFHTTHYHQVLEKQISEISIEIRTATGRLVPFNWGDCTVVLHFKKLSLY